MLLINFSEKASVVRSRLKTRTYLMLFLLLHSQTALSNGPKPINLEIATVENSINSYHSVFAFFAFGIVFIIVCLLGLVFYEMQKQPASKNLQDLIDGIHAQKIVYNQMQEEKGLMVNLNVYVNRRSIALTTQLIETSNIIEPKNEVIKERLTLLSCHSKLVTDFTGIINKYLT